jgi:hypothetical protein
MFFFTLYLFYRIFYDLFSNAVCTSGYVTSNGRVTNEWWIWKEVDGRVSVSSKAPFWRIEEDNENRVPPEAGRVWQFDRIYVHTPEPVSFVAILISSVWWTGKCVSY